MEGTWDPLEEVSFQGHLKGQPGKRGRCSRQRDEGEQQGGTSEWLPRLPGGCGEGGREIRAHLKDPKATMNRLE